MVVVVVVVIVAVAVAVAVLVYRWRRRPQQQKTAPAPLVPLPWPPLAATHQYIRARQLVEKLRKRSLATGIVSARNNAPLPWPTRAR